MRDNENGDKRAIQKNQIPGMKRRYLRAKCGGGSEPSGNFPATFVVSSYRANYLGRTNSTTVAGKSEKLGRRGHRERFAYHIIHAINMSWGKRARGNVSPQVLSYFRFGLNISRIQILQRLRANQRNRDDKAIRKYYDVKRRHH